MKKRTFRDAPAWRRCAAYIELRDGSGAQCGRRYNEDSLRNTGGFGALLCTQHGNMPRERVHIGYLDGPLATCRVLTHNHHRKTGREDHKKTEGGGE